MKKKSRKLPLWILSWFGTDLNYIKCLFYRRTPDNKNPYKQMYALATNYSKESRYAYEVFKTEIFTVYVWAEEDVKIYKTLQLFPAMCVGKQKYPLCRRNFPLMLFEDGIAIDILRYCRLRRWNTFWFTSSSDADTNYYLSPWRQPEHAWTGIVRLFCNIYRILMEGRLNVILSLYNLKKLFRLQIKTGIHFALWCWWQRILPFYSKCEPGSHAKPYDNARIYGHYPGWPVKTFRREICLTLEQMECCCPERSHHD